MALRALKTSILLAMLAGCASNSDPGVEFDSVGPDEAFSDSQSDLVRPLIPASRAKAEPIALEKLALKLNPDPLTWPGSIASLKQSTDLRWESQQKKDAFSLEYFALLDELAVLEPEADRPVQAEPMQLPQLPPYFPELAPAELSEIVLEDGLVSSFKSFIRPVDPADRTPVGLRQILRSDVVASQPAADAVGLVNRKQIADPASFSQILADAEVVGIDLGVTRRLMSAQEFNELAQALSAWQLQYSKTKALGDFVSAKEKSELYRSAARYLSDHSPSRFVQAINQAMLMGSDDVSVWRFENALARIGATAGLPLGTDALSALDLDEIRDRLRGVHGPQLALSIDSCVGNKGAIWTAHIPVRHRLPAALAEKLEGLSAIYSGNADEAGSCAAPEVLATDSGVLVRGAQYEIDLVLELLKSEDVPVLQVLVEVFLVQVDANWRRKLEVTLSGVRNVGDLGGLMSEGTLALARGIVGAENSFTFGGAGSRADTQAISNLVEVFEQNQIGRTISSPTLLVRDGVEASISRSRTIRFQGPSTQTTSSTNPPVTTITPGSIQSVNAPLELSVKPSINPETFHVVLDFSFVETTYDVANPDELSSSLTNEIKTTIETAPGEVAVLAGLYKETNSRDTLGLPGFTSTPLVAGLLGGSDDLQTQQSDLLVFISPRVIQPTKNEIDQSKSREDASDAK